MQIGHFLCVYTAMVRWRECTLIRAESDLRGDALIVKL
jgi:hypothetical protein